MPQPTQKTPRRDRSKRARKSLTTYEKDYADELDAEHAEQLQDAQTDRLLDEQDSTELGEAVGGIFWIRHLDGLCEIYCIYCTEPDELDEDGSAASDPREEEHDDAWFD